MGTTPGRYAAAVLPFDSFDSPELEALSALVPPSEEESLLPFFEDPSLAELFSPAELFAELEDAEPYPSAYHPPPLSMNPAPREICRFAWSLPHRGHFFSG